MSGATTPPPTLVAETLACLEGGRPLPRGVEPLPGGTADSRYRLGAGDEVLVLRIGTRNAGLLGIDRSREQAATGIVGSIRVGAELIWSDTSGDAMVTRFIPGPVLSSASASEPATLRRIVDSVRAVHAGPPIQGRFSPFDAASELHQFGLERGVVPPAELAEAFIVLARIEAVLPSAGPEVACHNDLHPGNLIDDGQRIRIVDWEYAAMGDRFFDLGNLAATLGLSDEGCRSLLEYYFDEVRDLDLARLSLMRMAAEMCLSCRGFLSHAISPPGSDGYAAGTRHLNRFLRTAREDGFLALLRRGSQPRISRPSA